MQMLKSLALYFAILCGSVESDNVGWDACFIENSEEFHDRQLTWENGESTNVPTWLTGVFVRNGPAQVDN